MVQNVGMNGLTMLGIKMVGVVTTVAHQLLWRSKVAVMREGLLWEWTHARGYSAVARRFKRVELGLRACEVGTVKVVREIVV